MKTTLYAAFATMIVLASCRPGVKPIDYALDKCDHCHMSIVDKQFGCEIVSQKGKVFKFDAVECMVNYIHVTNMDEASLAHIVTNTLDKPAELLDAKSAVYLVSENMPSPMGMDINPFFGPENASKHQSENGGVIYSWVQLQKYVRGE